MPDTGRKFPGWLFCEARWRCADPEQFAAFVDAHKRWRAARRPESFRERLNGGGFVRVVHVPSPLFDRRNESLNRLNRFLAQQLIHKRVVAWGRKGAPTADLQEIPASAWEFFRIINPDKSVLRTVTSDKTTFFEVRVFPIVESPSVIDRLEGMSLADAIQLCFARDPQLNTLRKRAGCSDVTSKSLSGLWPVLWAASKDNKPTRDPTENLDERAERNRNGAVIRLQQRRFAKLVNLFLEQPLVATGTSKDGTSVEASRSTWQGDRVYVDLESGDLLEVPPGANRAPKLLITGVVLRKAESVQQLPEIYPSDSLTKIKGKLGKNQQNAVTTTKSRSDCQDFLAGMMRLSPTVKRGTKAELRKLAQQKWPGKLSWEGFDWAWSAAIEETGAVAWSASGRPSKSPQPKSMHR